MRYNYQYNFNSKKVHIGAQLNFSNYTEKVNHYFKDSIYYHWPLNEVSGEIAHTLGTIPVGNNLVPNSGIEAYESDFYNGQKTTIAGEFRTGTAGLKATSTGTAVTVRVDCSVIAGKQYILNFWIRGDGTNAPTYGIARGDYASYIISMKDTGVTGSEFVQVTTSAFTAPVGYDKISVWFRTVAVNGAYFCVDDISVTPVDDISVDYMFGVYGNATLNQPGFNSNEKSVYFDGTPYSGVTLSTLIFNEFPPKSGSGTMLIWGKPDVDTLTEGESRWAVKLKTVAETTEANYIDMFTSSKLNTVGVQFRDDNLTPEINLGKDQFESEWLCMLATWSPTNGFRFYINGQQIGETKSITGTWTKEFNGRIGTIGSAMSNLESFNWKGYLSHCIISDSELSAKAIYDLSKI